MRNVFAILILALTCSCSMTDKIVQSSDRFDNIVMGHVDDRSGPGVIYEEDHVILIVDTIIRGDIKTVDGFVMTNVTHLSDSSVTVDRVPVKNLKFRSTISASNANFKNGNSIVVTLVDITVDSPEEELEVFMFGNKDLVLLDNSMDPGKESWNSLGLIYRINLKKKQFQKIVKRISRKAVK